MNLRASSGETERASPQRANYAKVDLQWNPLIRINVTYVTNLL